MKFLRFPPRPSGDDRDGTVRSITGRTKAANVTLAGSRTISRYWADPTDRRLLRSLTALQRPSIEILLARRPPARRILAAFRSEVPFPTTVVRMSALPEDRAAQSETAPARSPSPTPCSDEA